MTVISVIRNRTLTNNERRGLCRTAMKVNDDSVADSTIDRKAAYFYLTVSVSNNQVSVWPNG